MPAKRARPLVVGTVHELTDRALREAAGGTRGKVSEIIDAALRAYLKVEIPARSEKVAA